MEGALGTILRHDQTNAVTASVVAAGGEFVLDASGSKAAREDLVRLPTIDPLFEVTRPGPRQRHGA